MQREKVLKFFCVHCGQGTLIPEKMQPLGKKKKCRSCGQVFELNEQSMRRQSKTSFGQRRKMRQKQQQQANAEQPANTLKCYVCDYNLPIDPYQQKSHYNCPQCHSIVENPKAQPFPVGTVMVMTFIVIAFLFAIVYSLGVVIQKFSESFTASSRTTKPENDQPDKKDRPRSPKNPTPPSKIPGQKQARVSEAQKSIQHLLDAIHKDIQERRLLTAFRSLKEVEAICQKVPEQVEIDYRRPLQRMEKQLLERTLSILTAERQKLLSCLQNRTLPPDLVSASWADANQFLSWLEPKRPGISQQIVEVHQRNQECLQQHALARNLCKAIENSLQQKQLLPAWQAFDNFPDNCKGLYCNRTISYQQRLDDFQRQIIALARQIIESTRQQLQNVLKRNIQIRNYDRQINAWNSQERFLSWLGQVSPEVKKLYQEYRKLALRYQQRFPSSVDSRSEATQAKSRYQKITHRYRRKQLKQSWEGCRSFPEKWKDWRMPRSTKTYRQLLARQESQIIAQVSAVLQRETLSLQQKSRKLKSSHDVTAGKLIGKMASRDWGKGDFLAQLIKQQPNIAVLWQAHQQMLGQYQSALKQWQRKHQPAQFTVQVKNTDGRPCSNCRYRLFATETPQDKLNIDQQFGSNAYYRQWYKLPTGEIRQQHGGKYALAVQTANLGLLWHKMVLEPDKTPQIELVAQKSGSVTFHYSCKPKPGKNTPSRLLIRLIRDGLVYGVAGPVVVYVGKAEGSVTISHLQPGKYTMVTSAYFYNGCHLLVKDNLQLWPSGQLKVRLPRKLETSGGITLHFYHSKTKRPISYDQGHALRSALFLHNQDYVIATSKGVKQSKGILTQTYKYIPNSRYRLWVNLPGYHEVSKQVRAYSGWYKNNGREKKTLQFPVTTVFLTPIE